MIQVRVAHDGGRTHIEIRAGNSPATLHTTGTLNMDKFNGVALLDCLRGYYLDGRGDPHDIEIIEDER